MHETKMKQNIVSLGYGKEEMTLWAGAAGMVV